MNNRGTFLATYSNWRPIMGRKVVQIILEVPLEQSDEAYQALGGMPNPGESVWCAVVRMDPSKMEAAQKPPPEVPITTSSQRAGARNPLAQRAALLCKDELFHRYLEQVLHMEEMNEQLATAYLRGRCVVESRSQILPGTEAAQAFADLEDDFRLWRDAPQFAEQAT